jgi:hypothetical protein
MAPNQRLMQTSTLVRPIASRVSRDNRLPALWFPDREDMKVCRRNGAMYMGFLTFCTDGHGSPTLYNTPTAILTVA